MIAWVTGGGTGIGRALAQTLVREGYQVAISGRRKEVLAEAERVLAVPMDVSDAAQVQQAYATIRQRWGAIDLLINNAAVNPHHAFGEAGLEEFEQVWRINCLGAIACTKAVLPSLLEKKRGVIVNISSILGKWASAPSAAYSVSKYALAGFTDSLRQELAGSGIHVMGVYPGFILTPMTDPFAPPGTWSYRMAESPEAMAQAIWRGIRRHKREVLYPWYVPWVLRLHRWFPGVVEHLRRTYARH